MNNKFIIGERIAAALKSQGKLQKDLAAVLHVTDNTISYFCNGKRTPNIQQLIEIAQFFNTSVDWLLGLRDNQSSDPNESDICEYTGLSNETVRKLHEETKASSDNIASLADFVNFMISGDSTNQIYSGRIPVLKRTANFWKIYSIISKRQLLPMPGHVKLTRKNKKSFYQQR